MSECCYFDTYKNCDPESTRKVFSSVIFKFVLSSGLYKAHQSEIVTKRKYLTTLFKSFFSNPFL